MARARAIIYEDVCGRKQWLTNLRQIQEESLKMQLLLEAEQTKLNYQVFQVVFLNNRFPFWGVVH